MKRILHNKKSMYIVTLFIAFSFTFSGILVYNSLNPTSQTTLEEELIIYMSVDGISIQASSPNTPSDSIQVNTIIFAGLNLGLASGGFRTERLQMSDVVVEKFVDNTMTPQLWDDFFRNTRIPRVFFYVYGMNDEGSLSQEVIITLESATISSMVNSYTTTSSEQITFKFSTLTMEFQNGGQSVTYNYGR